MRRSAALAPLSRDHHHALVIAMMLTRANRRTAGSSARLFADFIAQHEARHFALEEALLLPCLPTGDSGHRLAERARADHRYMRELAEQFSSGQLEPSVELLHATGARLRAHVQMEERELFPHLERTLDAGTLERIGAKLRAAT